MQGRISGLNEKAAEQERPAFASCAAVDPGMNLWQHVLGPRHHQGLLLSTETGIALNANECDPQIVASKCSYHEKGTASK